MTDSKSVASDSVAVQVRPLVPNIKPTFQLFFCARNSANRQASVAAECRSNQARSQVQSFLIEADTETDF